MSARSIQSSPKPFRVTAAALLLALVPFALTLPGCSGCWKADPAAQKKKEEEERKRKEEEEKKKPDFEIGRLRVQPDDPLLNTYEVKPGHWVSTTQELRANNFNFPGELLSRTTNRTGQPVELEHVPYYFSSSRPAPLPKGQTKHIEVTYFVPRAVDGVKQNVQFDRRLQSQRGGREVIQDRQPTTRMPAYRYYFVGLSSRPEAYGYLKRLDTVAPPWDDLSGDLSEALIYYRVALPPAGENVPLPEHPLTWTAVACVLWDDLDPAALTPSQQQAMLDWLHWGGQLIINGPNGLDRLRDSFLGPVLPATGGAAGTLEQEDFAELNAAWSRSRGGGAEKAQITIDPERKPSGLALELKPGGSFVPGTGELVAERRCGRGRVVATRFSLTSRTVINWAHFDNFFNGCLLRRPGRTFKAGQLDTVIAEWTRHPHLSRDARLVSTLRYFTRDVARSDGSPAPEVETSNRFNNRDPFDRIVLDTYGGVEEEKPYVAPEKVLGGDPWHFGGHHTWSESGVAGWNDFSGVAQAVREALREAAGISIPDAGFVIRVLAVYVVLLVPVNWLLFRLMGRVEWAWIAAPVIAVLGAFGVIRMAQLDIGFARSRTEVAVLELYGGYGRGHLTRYSALYSSLSSRYQMDFTEDTALALPFAVDPTFRRLSHPAATAVTARHERGLQVEGFRVASNSTGMVHTEEMVDAAAGLIWEGVEGEYKLTNGTPLKLLETGLLRRTEDGRLEAAWIGELEPEAEVTPKFEPADALTLPEWEQSPVMGSGGPEGEIALARIRTVASRQLELAPGEVRLIAWTENPGGGLTISPDAAQTTIRTFVLAHLTLGEFPEPEQDENLRAVVKAELDRRSGVPLD